MTFIDVYTGYANPGYLVYGVGRAGSVQHLGTHYPWFMVYVKPSLLPRLRAVLDNFAKKGMVVNYEELDPYRATPLILKGVRYEPDPGYVPVEVRCRRKEVVPNTAEQVRRAVGEALVGEHNIVYPVRVSFDFDIKYFHERCPVLFVPNSELESVSLEIIDRHGDFKILSFDIEVYTTSGRFPAPGDPILSLQYAATTLENPDVSDPGWVKDNVVVLTASRADEGESEEIASRFLDVLRKERPDVIVGYNSVAFDMKYLKPFLGQRSDRILSDFYHVNLVDYVFPHVDLLLVRKSMGSSLGIRSLVAQALDDVVKEAVRDTKFGWLIGSELMDAESKLDHMKLVREWEARSKLFYSYVTADAYLTLVLAYLWMYTLILVSSLVQVPISQLSKLNLGQVAEYNFVHYLERLGFRTTVIERKSEFRKATNLGAFTEYLKSETASLFSKGKVYVKDYGVFSNVVEGDFSQLYPTLMANDTLDPLGLRHYFAFSTRTHEPIDSADPLLHYSKSVLSKRFPVLLGVKAKKSADHMVPRDLVVVVPVYGPISFLVYKMYTMRRVTKRLKKRAATEGRPELASVDQAVKILNNASYGSFSKRRGFINPALSGYIFWKTLKILYDVIEYVEKGLGVTVLYGDTDSLFVKCKEDEARSLYPQLPTKEACFRWFSEVVVQKVNEYVRSRYGKEFELSPEDAFDMCVYPKSKYENAPSKKSYICVNVSDGDIEVEVVKGEFYKATAPEGIKDRMQDFYKEILKRKPKTPEGVLKIAEEVLSGLPPHKYFMKKTVDTFESERLPDTTKTYEFKLKRLNKTFHYAALHLLFTTYERVPEIAQGTIQVLSDIERSGGRSRTVTYIIDAERLLRERGNVVVYFLPSDSPTKFTVFVDYDEKTDTVTVHNVSVKRVEIVTEQRGEGVYSDVGYRVEETYAVLNLPRSKILVDSINSMRKYIVDDVSKKLLPVLHARPQSLSAYASKKGEGA